MLAEVVQFILGVVGDASSTPKSGRGVWIVAGIVIVLAVVVVGTLAIFTK